MESLGLAVINSTATETRYVVPTEPNLISPFEGSTTESWPRNDRQGQGTHTVGGTKQTNTSIFTAGTYMHMQFSRYITTLTCQLDVSI